MGFSAYNNSTKAQKSQVIIYRIIKSYMNNFIILCKYVSCQIVKTAKKYNNIAKRKIKIIKFSRGNLDSFYV